MLSNHQVSMRIRIVPPSSFSSHGVESGRGSFFTIHCGEAVVDPTTRARSQIRRLETATDSARRRASALWVERGHRVCQALKMRASAIVVLSGLRLCRSASFSTCTVL